MSIQYLRGLRVALICAALAVVLVPISSALAEESIQDAGETSDEAGGSSTINHPRLYPRANYVWPFADGPHYGDVPGAALSEGVPGLLVTPVGSFHLGHESLPFPTELRGANRLGPNQTAQYFIVATSDELDVRQEVIAKIEANGGRVVEFLPYGALIARLNVPAQASIASAVGMMAIEPYHPALKLHPEIGRHPLPDPLQAMSEVYELDLELWPDEDPRIVAAATAKLGANVTSVAPGWLHVVAHRDLLPRLAALEPVKMIFESLPVFALAEETTTVMQTGQYNAGAIPYHAAGVNGGGSNFGFCANGTTVCQRGSEPTNCTPPQLVNTCTPNPQILMVLDSGISLDAGDLSDTRTAAGTAGAAHRKVLAYESTAQFTGGSGDLLGCDSPTQGGRTHGHTVSTTALGNATAVPTGYGASWFAFDQQQNPWKLDGVAPRAKLIAYDGQVTSPTANCSDPLQDTITPGTNLWTSPNSALTSLGKSYLAKAKIVNFSWGTTANVYATQSTQIDQFLAANRDSMVFISAGNSGQDANNDGVPDPLTLGSPATAKNALAIGASRTADTTNQPESREVFSSCGPAVNNSTINRIAPQLMAPGGEAGAGSLGLSSEYSCRSADNDQLIPVQCDIIQPYEGTSFSAPAAAGAGLIVRDYFFQGYYPNRVPGVATSVPIVSGALVKVALIASADFMSGANLTEPYRWNNEQGMGRIQLDNVLPLENWPASPTGLIVHDTLNSVINVSNLNLPASVSPGNSHSSNFSVCNDQEEIRIALAWNDPQNAALRNNLNLEVTAPSGKVYRGNYFNDDNDRNNVIAPAEDCPGIGDLAANNQIDRGQWSLPTCVNSAIPLGDALIPTAFDQRNVIEGIFLSPDADGNCSGANPVPGCFHDGTCIAGGNLGGVDALGACGNDLDCSTDPVNLTDNPVCDGGTKQPEIGDWQITVSAGTPFAAAQDFSILIAGGVCVGSTVKFNRGSYTCNAGAKVQVTELAEAGDPGCSVGSCPISTIQNRTTVRAFDENGVEVDCEGPGCSVNPTTGLVFTQASTQALLFESKAVNLTDGTVPQPGNGTLDVQDGYTVEALYADDDPGPNPVERRSSAVVACQVAIGFGDAQIVQFGQDQGVLVQGGCERALPRIGESQGFFEYGFPDKYMDADELIQFAFAFNSDETVDLENVVANLRCVKVDPDSPATCLPSGAGCEPADCGPTQVCDPRRNNNLSCPYLSILDSPKTIARLPANSVISANFAIQVGDPGVFASTSPTVEMILEVSANTAGKTASGLAISRQRLNIDTTETLYNTDFPTGGVTVTYDFNENETVQNPITDLSGFQALDYRFEEQTYGNLTAGTDANGAAVSRNLNLRSPWNFDGNNGGFTNGLNSTTDEASAQPNLIHNWGEDKNFNRIQDGVCTNAPGIACYSIGSDPRCPGIGQPCSSIENNANDGITFTQNHNQRGGCGWQTRPPHVCSDDSTRGCFTDTDCFGTCQQTGNSILSTFTACGTGQPGCPSVQQCTNSSQFPFKACTVPTVLVDCGSPGSCQTVGQTCVSTAGTCNLGSTATKGGIWHTGRIGDQGVGLCDGTPNSQCQFYKVITTQDNELIWWEQLLTPELQKVDQEIVAGLPNSRIEINYWAWNMSTDLADNNVSYTWEFDTDTETITPADLVSDGTALNAGDGPYGAVQAVGNPDLTDGFSVFAPMGRCSGGDGACRRTAECPAGTCSNNPLISCHLDDECTPGNCVGEETCIQQTTSTNGTAGNSRHGKNSCFFEGPLTISVEAFADLGTAHPRDDDFDNDGDAMIDEFVTAAGPIRNHDVVSFNGDDMRLFTLEDLYGDTGNRFRAAIGILNFEGNQTQATRSYGIGVDDMYIEWKEFTLDLDVTSCATGSCAVLEVPTSIIYQANTVLGVSLLENTPYNHACNLGTSHGAVCFTSNPVCPGGSCQPAFNDCDLDGNFRGTGDDDDCNDNSTPDVVVRATSESDIEGAIVVLDRQGPTSNEYTGDLTVSILAKSPGVLFLAQNGQDSPTITTTYRDYHDGTGHLCQNSVIPEQQGLVLAFSTALIPDCDVQLAETSFVDNGDSDLFADSDETLALSFEVRNNCGLDLTGCSARLSTESEFVECIQTSVVPLGTLEFDELAPPVQSTAPFVFKITQDADRVFNGLDPDDAHAAAFTIAFTCNEIDANTFPQDFALTLDLNLSAGGQPSEVWLETFETATLGKFTAENLDAGMPGNNNIEGLINGDGWRCQYSNPDWVNGSSYGQEEALDCFPTQNLAHSNQIFWQIDGTTALHTGPKKAYRGNNSLYYGVWLDGALAGEFTTPLGTVESVRTTTHINLGVGDPELSFWHMISLVDHRTVGSGLKRNADRGVVQIQTVDSGGFPTSPWTNLSALQNSYDQQGGDNFFNCMFDPIDDGNDEDDFFDPTDPARSLGPSSTCFPAFSYAWMGNTADPFNPADIGWATTPPVASDSPDLGPGTWVESVMDLSDYRGRRAKLRYIVTSIKASEETHEAQFELNPLPNDDGWWIDNISVDDTLATAAQILNDDYNLRSCSTSGNACIAKCSVSLATCGPSLPACGVGQTCLLPCLVGETCTGPAPGCGLNCTSVTTNVVAETESEELLNPSSMTTAAPGQVISFNAADTDDPSSADACLSGTLQFRFCISGDPDGGGGGLPDADCDDSGLDQILRGWTENPTYTDAPQASGSYVTEVRCSTAIGCKDSHKVDVTVACPPGPAPGVNALGLADVRASEICSGGPNNGLACVCNECLAANNCGPPLSGFVCGGAVLTWSGAPLPVDTWVSDVMDNSSDFLAPYPGIASDAGVATTQLVMGQAVPDPAPGDPGNFRAYLMKAEGATNHTNPLVLRCSRSDIACAVDTDCPEFNGSPPPVGEACLPLQITGYFCNSRTWRSGGLAEIPEDNEDPAGPAARDETLGNPGP